MKKIFSIIIGILIIISWGMVIYRNGTLPRAYSNALENVKEKCEDGYFVEAQELLDEAVSLNEGVSTYESDALQRDIYLGLKDDGKYISFLKKMIENYPDKVENYEKLVSFLYEQEEYKELCKCIDEYSEICSENAVVQDVNDKFSKQTRYNKTNYYTVKYINGEILGVQKKEFEKNEEGLPYTNMQINKSSGDEVFNHDMIDISISVDENKFYVRNQEGVWTLVDGSLNLLAKNDTDKFEWIGRMGTNGITPVILENGEKHFINSKMAVNDLVWDDFSAFNDDFAAVCKNGKWALVSTENLLTNEEFPYADIAINDSGFATVDGMAVVSDGSGYFVITTDKMEPVSKEKFDELKAFNSTQPIAYRDGSKWGFVWSDGTICTEAMYDDARSYINGYACVMKNGLWGVVDKYNNMIVEPQYTEMTDVMNNGYIFVLNEEGTWDIVIIDRLYYQN